MKKKCLVCDNYVSKPSFTSNKSITSLGTLFDQKTVVWWCNKCTHLQNSPIRDIKKFYKNNYNILVESEDEDQLYYDSSGNKKYRNDHQVDCIIEKFNFPRNTKILDFGSGKGHTLKKLSEKNSNIIPHMFDISDVYKKYWEDFCNKENYCTFRLPKRWSNYFDYVFSFFALEHATRPFDFLKKQYKLVRNSGFIYGIVPNVFQNPGDMCVLDHVNHFSPLSLKILLKRVGFSNITIDTNSHYGAIIFKAKKTTKISRSNIKINLNYKKNIILK